jgi:TrmH family RNA methyltransferase
MTITSTANPRVRLAIDLRDRKHRRESNQFLIEGTVEIGKALEAGVEVDLLFYDVTSASNAAVPLLQQAQQAGADTLAVDRAVADRICVRGGPVLAIARCFSLALELFDPPLPELVLAVEHIEKPGNIGAMLRTAAAVGASLLVCDELTDVFNPSAVRSSLGTLFSVAIAQAGAREARGWLREHSVTLLAAVPDAPTPFWEADLAGPVAIAIGAEDTGLTPEMREGAESVSIPMAAGVDSLNASVAAAVFLYEATRQRRVVV